MNLTSIIPYTRETLVHEMHRLALPAPLLVVSDVHTTAAAGFVPSPPFAHAEHLCFETSPKADMATAEALTARARQFGAVLAVGSGTLNDLCKYAAYHAHVPYAVLATAPSMNGYVAPNSSLYQDGQKHSFPVRTPIALLYDSAILAAAPPRLIASGVGDTLCRTTVMRDVWLSHQLCGTAFDAEMFAELHLREVALLEALEGGNTNAIVTTLMQALIASGKAMADAGSSAPASQGEHMLAHVLEMLDPTLSERHYHGEIIAVTTLIMARLQEHRMTKLLHGFQPASFPEIRSVALLGEANAARWKEAYAQKKKQFLSHSCLRGHDGLTVTASFEAYSLSSATLQKILEKARCPTSAAAIGVDVHTLNTAVSLASFSRERFTWLDMQV
jgi:glycerol-1-phosphate dehydrogenase [NAD(P)+]